MDNFGKLIDAVEKLCDESENIDTRGAVQIVMANVCDFSFLAFLHLWSDVLEEINHTQRYQKIERISLDKALNILRGLKFCTKLSQKCEEMYIDVEKRGKRRPNKGVI